MKTRFIADQTDAIAQRLKELEAETTARINGISLEDAKPVEAPADIDWTGIYGYPAGFKFNQEPSAIWLNTNIKTDFKDFIG